MKPKARLELLKLCNVAQASSYMLSKKKIFSNASAPILGQADCCLWY